MLELPERAGPRPATSTGIPHRQLDQTAPAAVHERVARRFAELPGTEHGPSLISVPGARALFVPACARCNARYGFMRGREFAHLHPPDDGSLHVVLAPDDLASVLARGWGEPHPLAATGGTLPTVAMIYAPRDDAEADVVLAIVAASLENATSTIHAPDGSS